MGIGSRKDPGFQAALNASLRRRLDGTGNLLRPGEQMRLFNTWKRVRSKRSGSMVFIKVAPSWINQRSDLRYRDLLRCMDLSPGAA